MRIILGLLYLICFATLMSCSKQEGGSAVSGPSSSGIVTNNVPSNSGTVSVKAAPLSEAVANSIIAEKVLYIQTTNANLQIQKDIETVASDASIKSQTAVKGDELLNASKSIIDCSTTSAVDTCL